MCERGWCGRRISINSVIRGQRPLVGNLVIMVSGQEVVGVRETAAEGTETLNTQACSFF